MRSLLPLLAALALTVVALVPASRTSWSPDDAYVLTHLRSPEWRVRLSAYDVDRPSMDAGSWWDGVRYQRRFIRALPAAIMAAEVAAFGQRPWPLHLVTLALHLMSVGLLYLLALRVVRDPWKAALVAALFGVHPIAFEVIGWFALQPLALAAVLSLAATEAWIRYRTGGGTVWLWAALALVAGALASYEASVVLPIVLVAGDLLLYRPAGRERWAPRIAVLALLVPYLALSVLMRRSAPELETLFRPGVAESMRIARVDFANYVFKSLGLIDPQAPGRYWVYNALGEPLALLVVAVLFAAIVWWSRKRPIALIGLLAFVAFLAPPWLIRSTVGALNIPSLRQVYLPLIGVVALVATALAGLRARTAALVLVPFLIAFTVFNQVPRRGLASRSLAAAGEPVKKALAGVDPARPVVMVGTFLPPAKASCGYELSLDWPGRAEMRLVPPSRSGAVPRLVRTGERTFIAAADEGLLIAMKPAPFVMPQGMQPGFNSGGFRITTQPPPLVRDRRQQLDGAAVEVVDGDATTIRSLRFTLDRPLEEYAFLAVSGCRDIRPAVFESASAQ